MERWVDILGISCQALAWSAVSHPQSPVARVPLKDGKMLFYGEAETGVSVTLSTSCCTRAPGLAAVAWMELDMVIGKRLLLFSERDPRATELGALTNDWGCLTTTAETTDDLRGRVEGADYDMVLVDDAAVLRRLCAEADPSGALLQTPLAEVEKRHIFRVLSSSGGNKTRAAKVLGIDTKTLYNKLKAYGASAQTARRRQVAARQDAAT